MTSASLTCLALSYTVLISGDDADDHGDVDVDGDDEDYEEEVMHDNDDNADADL